MGIDLPKIFVPKRIISDIDEALRREWVITNSLGGYASSTVLGINTRKYHGLLIAAFNPPVDRRVLLSKLDEEIVFKNESHPIGSNEFKKGIDSTGYTFLSHFKMDPFPTFRYSVGNIQLHKTIVLIYERNAVIIYYRVFNPNENDVTIRITPLVNSRHFHSVTNIENTNLNFFQKQFDKGLILKSSLTSSSLLLFSSSGSYHSGGKWVKEIYYREEDRRGESCLEDEFQPGFFEIQVRKRESKRFQIIAVGDKDEKEARNIYQQIWAKCLKGADTLINNEVARRKNLLRLFQKKFEKRLEDWLKWLILAADSFIVNRRSTEKKSVIAGYHWFEDWGRDSLISFSGLTLVTGRFKDAREILLTFRDYCHEGVIPNRFPDSTGEKPVYNTVDATLWYFNALLNYLKYTGDFCFVERELWETLKSILDQHIQGTIYGIHLDKDGLLAHGPQLTWMDVKVGGRAVSPRDGKAVEIQALWYNALKTAEFIAEHLNIKEEAEKYSSIAERARNGFLKKFWNPEKNCLFDVVDGEQLDLSLRPNQVIAAMLDFSMLNKMMCEKVVEVVNKELWGAFGLKTLSKNDIRYVGVYVGDRAQRDKAYHNGTVWPWLLGPFLTAFLKVKQYEKSWRTFTFETYLKPLFLEEIYQAGLGNISEIFDGDPPHTPRGCIAQAWSVAEPLRVYIEDVSLLRPPYEGLLKGFLEPATP